MGRTACGIPATNDSRLERLDRILVPPDAARQTHDGRTVVFERRSRRIHPSACEETVGKRMQRSRSICERFVVMHAFARIACVGRGFQNGSFPHADSFPRTHELHLRGIHMPRESARTDDCANELGI